MTAPQYVLDLRGVSKSFSSPGGAVHVLRKVDLTVASGEFAAITGPSGSGKSTFLNLAALLDVPTGGRLFFEEHDASEMTESELSNIRKRKVGMVFQGFNLLPHRSALDNVMFRFRYLDVSPDEARSRSEEALAAMGLSALAHQPARLLSGGEMQRVAIARAFAQRPRLLLADEPTGNLDRDAARTVMQSFTRLHDEGICILLATHNPDLLSYCSRHLVCRDGVVVDEVTTA